MLLEKGEAIAEFNELGGAKQPFYFLIDFKGENAYVATTSQDDLFFSINQQINEEYKTSGASPFFSFQKAPEPKRKFEEKFDKVISEIKYGNSFLVNLTIKTPIATSLKLDEIYLESKAKYKALVPGKFTFFSPETFVQIKDNSIFSHPMKGTIDAAIPDARQKILDDPKETAEHITIVDLIRNDVSRIASDVEVTRFRYIEEVKTHEKTLLQVSSEIKGKMKKGWQDQLGTLLFSMLPAGSISGAPKDQTLKIIEDTETYERGFYTGICGYFDGENLDTGVMIRFIEQENGRLFFKSGGGITSFSNLDSEYREMIDKIYVPIR